MTSLTFIEFAWHPYWFEIAISISLIIGDIGKTYIMSWVGYFKTVKQTIMISILKIPILKVSLFN
ncbi:hypothetical protein C9J48_12935 [Photobacterium profundum]|nr:hypothetical protein C9J48_12935 [Photobacterium profundum]